MTIKALIIDDEPLAQNVIKQYALKIPSLEIIGACNDAICAQQFLHENEVDLLFLDINMPKLSGISFLKNLKKDPLVIFTTAYSEYALEGYELNAIDYLKKPFSFERFFKAYTRAEELHLLKTNAKNVPADADKNEFLFIKANKKSVKIKFSDILYIEGLGDYIKIHLTDEKLVTNLSMKKIFSLLPQDMFYRTHKSFIISVDKIDSLEGNMVCISGEKLPIGNSYRQEFFEYVSRFSAD
ncbi:LytTR family DNA-binding domain-containing protein [Draconibacterium sp. IB214405]|uniref:LytR/AlgR family response regulator transcription factor n=1 Tax=Draconibacterium sp. IB214405 TaxID=3097352 RepID=UPI002A112C98|nr:LytTR family DNA-binding domain-containing protein [Draconibacterium sp. IB214405]MDX8338701.1 LytTR family DNA-binding domain-containing protein [Draconibacterium sp. IB214405]